MSDIMHGMSGQEHGGGGGAEVHDSGVKDGFGRLFAFLSIIPHIIFTFVDDDEKNRIIARQHAATGGGGGGGH
jgi:hypothetical protein